ncbi:unnamed protein product [Paramecium primaurelia]|uniref:WD40-repeat-containing domain n=1 Tax=Paramecium primaurelia TaxID=5886 RepID=A0A8S1LSV9_PARPR|nr:unnamed protein product [Paramecium primaurelia]
MIINCSHQKIGYLIEQQMIKEVCDICNDIECIESHKFILKTDLLDFQQKALPLLTQLQTILYDQLPNQIDQLNKMINQAYQGFTKSSQKKQIENLMSILQNEEQKYQFQLINFYIARDQIKQIKEKLKEVIDFELIIQRCISQFNQNQNITKEVQTINFDDDQDLIQTTNKEQTDQLFIKQIDIPILNQNIIEKSNNFEIPTTFKFKRMYSITWLNENLLGIAAGDYNPYIIFDPQMYIIKQQIFQEKNGVYDSIAIGNDRIILAYVHNIKMFQWINNQYIANKLQFEESQGTPSKLYYCSQTQSIFATNTFFQVISQNYVYQWKLDSGKLIKYKIQGSTFGPMCLINQKLIFCFSLWEMKSRSQRQNLIYFWQYEQNTPIKKIDTSQPQYAMIVKMNQLFGFGSEITIWNLDNYHLIKKITYPDKKLNPWCVCSFEQSLILGCEDGNIIIVNEQFNKWDKIMKMRAKTMKMNVLKDKCVIAALDCSFSILQIKK